jgi:Ca2+/Na+ antiporter
MFWGIAFICEEYSVPAITAFCRRNKISDHITGSIFIGTGLSLPVLFVALVGLFVSNSAIGVGAVVGGNLFNHLVTIPTSIYVTPDQVLKLEPLVFTRELFCYFISCLILIWATQNGHLIKGLKRSMSQEQWESCLTIPWFYSFVLLLGFVLYCIINAYFDQFMDLFHYLARKIKAIFHGYLPHYFPLPHFSGIDDLLSIKTNPLKHMSASSNHNNNNNNNNDNNNDNSNSCPRSNTSHSNNPLAVHEVHPENDNKNIQDEKTVDQMESGVSLTRITSPPSSPPPAAGEAETNKRDSHNFEDRYSVKVDVDENNTHKPLDRIDEEDGTEDSPVNIYEIPSSYFQRFLFIFTFPMKLMIYLTVPDVRRPVHQHRAILSFTICLVWLAIQSYILTVALTLLGNWWGINGAVMGLTVAAWASNYPAHWSSVIVARANISSSADDIACELLIMFFSFLDSDFFLLFSAFFSVQCVRIKYFQQFHWSGFALVALFGDLSEAIRFSGGSRSGSVAGDVDGSDCDQLCDNSGLWV